MSEKVSSALSDKFGCRVEVGSVKVDFPGMVTADSLLVCDKEGREMLRVSCAVGTVDVLPLLLHGKVCIGSLKVFGVHATLRRIEPQADGNWQFIVDSLMPARDDGKGMEVNLRSLLVRDMSVSYDVESEPHSAEPVDWNHIDIERLNASIVFKSLERDKFSALVRNMELRLRGGIGVEDMRATITPAGSGRYMADVGTLVLMLGDDVRWHAEDSRVVFDSREPVFMRALESADINSALTVGSRGYDILAMVTRNNDNTVRPVAARLAVSRRDGGQASVSLNSGYDIGKSLDADFNINVMGDDLRECLSLPGLVGIKAQVPENQASAFLAMLDSVNMTGHVDINYGNIVCNGSAKSNLCDFTADIAAHGGRASYDLQIAKARIPDNVSGYGGVCVDNAAVSGELSYAFGDVSDIPYASLAQITKGLSATLNAKVGSLSYGGDALGNIDIVSALNDGSLTTELTVDDPKARLKAKGDMEQIGEAARLTVSADIDALRLCDFVLLRGFMPPLVIEGKATVGADNIFASPDNWSLSLSDIHTTDNEGNVRDIDRFILGCNSNDNGVRHYALDCDFANGGMDTDMSLAQVLSMVRGQITDRLPALKNMWSAGGGYDSMGFANMMVHVSDVPILADVLGSEVTLERPATITANVSGSATGAGRLSFTFSAPAVVADEARYEDLSAYLNCGVDSLVGAIMMTKYFGSVPVRIENHLSGRDDKVFSEVLWKNLVSSHTYGSLKTETQLHRTEGRGIATITRVLPTNLFVADTLWQISPATVEYGGDFLRISDLIVSRGDQYVNVNANINGDKRDVHVQLNDVEVAYLLGLTNFKPVTFGGKASGSIRNSLVNPDKELEADLTVRDFLFNGAYLGSLKAQSIFFIDGDSISVRAKAQASPHDSTLIDGLVKLRSKELDFRFKSEKTNVQFLNKYVGRFIDDLEGNTTGDFHLFGTFKYVQMEADEVINHLKFRPKMLGTLYTLENQPMHIRPDTIDFTGFVVRDPYGNTAEVRGSVNHHYLFNFNYNFDFQLNDLLTINWKEQPSRSFWGTVFTDGLINLSGTTRDVRMSGELSAVGEEGNSALYYNSGAVGSETSRDYIIFTPSPAALASIEETAKAPTSVEKTEANVHMDIKLNATPDATLNIVTDPITRDYMSLRGSGPLQISYFNKGQFQLNGLYAVSGGSYKLTIKDIIHKNFDIQSGGYLRFHGLPSEADINLKGVHRVNSVSLSDLNVGASHSNSTVGVDCILNFTGKAADPKVSFDIDFPRANNDENLLLKKYILTEEDRNMQAVYLLSIGRFYTYNYNDFSSNTGAQDQSTVAMTSFLAGTLSGQINNILQDAFHITNWNFGTNIAAGRMGFNDMEVQGSLSGKMFNNRLLFNGNIGYRDQMTTYSNNFVGDFNLQWLLNKAGTISLKAYSETNDRYFTKSSLTTQGGGILFQKDFRKLREFFKK